MAAARRGGRDNVGGILLGRGEDDKKVHAWLTTAAGVLGCIDFAVGRTAFWGPRVGWRARKTMREAAVAEIARRYWEMVCLLVLVLVAWGVRWASQYTACWMMTACSFPRRSPAQIPR